MDLGLCTGQPDWGLAEEEGSLRAERGEDDGGKLDRFVEWLENGGVRCKNRVTVEQFSGVRGLGVLQDVQSDEELFRIPGDLLVNSREILRHPLFQDGESAPGHQILLGSWLLMEQQKGDQSAHHPYIDLLPGKDDFEAQGGPLEFWSEEELAMLECPVALELLQYRLNLLENAYLRLQRQWPKVVAGPIPSFECFKVAVAVAYSRCFRSSQGDEPLNMVFAPLTDMMNHDHPTNKNVRAFFNEAGEMVAESTQHRSAGEQLLITYGELPNLHLLQSNGFTMSENSYDFAVVDAQRLLSMIPETNLQFLLEKSLLLPDPEGKVSRWQPVSKRLEKAIALYASSESNFLQQMVEDTLSTFTTGYGEDRQLLETLESQGDLDGASMRSLHAARIRFQQKRDLLKILN
eukprot:CAMPEP_0113968370 /NCGR_PEP_ID=MMETSP0011_2-20120614/9493_1 /TAXON_ID=101924 /ORGANISM="Rhodosorus marinus" /LENGTH=404 /DNA_ID=CAMNT_0000981447 /DNA_START=406 /DNA_END=1621 /DNA_ORIENTATION=+ /assembly_acc=CAM_ASM_000156